MKQTLPRPQDLTEADKRFLLPKMAEQNAKLRAQVTDLLGMLEDYSIAFFSRKNDKHQAQRYQPDETLRERDRTLAEKAAQIRHYQREIKDLRKQLQESYNIDRLVEIEDDVRAKKQRVRELQAEEAALGRVQAEQQQALRAINREGDYEEKIAEMAAELRLCKKQYREAYYAQVDNDKRLIERHDALLRLDSRVRKMQAQLKQQSGKARSAQEADGVT